VPYRRPLSDLVACAMSPPSLSVCVCVGQLREFRLGVFPGKTPVNLFV
jgi:hypothetical protein